MNGFKLSNGLILPEVGYGTYKVEGQDGAAVVVKALEAGYRLLDTASFYKNEEEVGEGIRRSGIDRSEIVITSKAWRDEMGYEEILAAFDRSCKRLGVDTIDLYLLHWPRVPYSDPDWRQHNADSWRAMEKLYREGKVKAIGLSNFLPHHIDPLLETAEILPMVDQLEIHPGWTQRETVKWCQQKGILVEAWSPMGRRRVMEHPVVVQLAEKYQVSWAQICLRYVLDMGVLPLPKSGDPGRMAKNLELEFSLTPEDRLLLDSIEPCGWSGEDPDRTAPY